MLDKYRDKIGNRPLAKPIFDEFQRQITRQSYNKI